MSMIDKTGRLAYGATVAATGANAGAGSEAGTITVPAGERWLLLGIGVECVQGITQTPWPRVVITDGAYVFAAQSGAAAQAASTTCKHSWSPNGPTVGPTGATTACTSQGTIPSGLVLEAGATIATLTVGIGANTDYGVMAAKIVRV
jgi:hypothetical protein